MPTCGVKTGIYNGNFWAGCNFLPASACWTLPAEPVAAFVSIGVSYLVAGSIISVMRIRNPIVPEAAALLPQEKLTLRSCFRIRSVPFA